MKLFYPLPIGNNLKIEFTKMNRDIKLLINYNKEVYPLEFDPNCTLSGFKELIEFLLGVPKNRQKFLGIKNLNNQDQFVKN
jgi:hypothetical protein